MQTLTRQGGPGAAPLPVSEGGRSEPKGRQLQLVKSEREKINLLIDTPHGMCYSLTSRVWLISVPVEILGSAKGIIQL
jgi:hypothetical protein